MIDIFDEKFGIEVRKKMIDLHLTQERLSNLLGISQAYLSDILLDRRKSRKTRTSIVALLNRLEQECQINKKKPRQ